MKLLIDCHLATQRRLHSSDGSDNSLFFHMAVSKSAMESPSV